MMWWLISNIYSQFSNSPIEIDFHTQSFQVVCMLFLPEDKKIYWKSDNVPYLGHPFHVLGLQYLYCHHFAVQKPTGPRKNSKVINT